MELPEIINKMDQLRDELNALRPIPEDRMNRMNQKLRLDWNYHSNSIEGNTLSASETRAFILHGITANGKPFRDYVEMRGHNEALKKLEDIVHHDLRITENLIKEFHKIILVEPFDSVSEINPGEYKTHANYLYTITGERIDFESPQEVPRLMNELVNWLNNHIDPPKRKKKHYDLHPLMIACAFHVRFIQIHPFGDGNGRMARILMNLILMLCGYVPAVIKLDKRNDYYTALNQSTLDNPKPLAEYVGEECIQSLEMALKAAKGESIEEDEDLDKRLSLLKQEIDAEDNENEIKTRLTVGAVHSALKNWGYDLLKELAKTTLKFNDFYEKSNHSIDLAFDDNELQILFKNNLSFDYFELFFDKYHKDKLLSEARINLECRFSSYKKGGLHNFDCMYFVAIVFNTYDYEVNVCHFDAESQGLTIETFTQKLLHKSLLTEEIKAINKQWGESLYNHLEYNRKLYNGNDKS